MIETILVSRVTESSLAKPLVRLALRFNILVLQWIGWTIQESKEGDSFDCIYGKKKWAAGVGPRRVHQRLRLLFECNKLLIANGFKDPKYLRYDAGVIPVQYFFVLVTHFGRKGLQQKIRAPIDPPGPCFDWDGEERRVERSSSGGSRRMSDDTALIELVRKGKAIDYHDPTRKPPGRKNGDDA